LRYKDYRCTGTDRQQVKTLAADEFIRRFLFHLLPPEAAARKPHTTATNRETDAWPGMAWSRLQPQAPSPRQQTYAHADMPPQD
jgi:hypothetical protein